MRPDEREVAGLTCSAVMAELSHYVDGDVPDDLRARIEAHVGQCQVCERFGTGFSRLLAGMRRHLSEPEPVPGDVLDRLRGRLAG